MSTHRQRGILYIASGKPYIEEACRSAESVKHHHPDLSITLFTHSDAEHDAFDQVIVRDDLAQLAQAKEKKITYLGQSPYRETLFLDTDTYICGDLFELFPLLQSFDFAAAHAPSRLYYEHGPYPSDLPESFPEMNTGVLLYQSDAPNVQGFLKQWLDCYRKMRRIDGVDRDQISFREVLFGSELRVATLPSEYNCRFNFPVYLDGPAKILHGRHPTLNEKEIERIINRNGEVHEEGIHRRVFYIQTGRLHRPWEAKPSIQGRLYQIIKHVVLILRDMMKKDAQASE